MHESFKHNFEKIATIRGRALRELRTIMSSKPFWSHNTRLKNLPSIAESGIQSAQDLMKTDKLKNIEFVPKLKKEDIRLIKEKGSQGYTAVQDKYRPSERLRQRIHYAPIHAISVLKNSLTSPKEFGTLSILGRDRQLNRKFRKIVKTRGIEPIAPLTLANPRAGLMAEELGKALALPKRVVHKQKSSVLQLIRGRAEQGESAIVKPRGIKLVSRENVLVVPKKHITGLRKQYRGLTFVAREDLDKQFPKLTVRYHK